MYVVFGGRGIDDSPAKSEIIDFGKENRICEEKPSRFERELQKLLRLPIVSPSIYQSRNSRVQTP